MMNFLPGCAPAADAMTAEKVRMDLIAQNIANAQTVRDANGQPYQRKIASFEAYMDPNNQAAGKPPMLRTVRIAGIYDDKSPGPRVYNPGHPFADAQGMVQMPNVQLSQEMVDLISASRAYEANTTVIRTSRQMATQALSIGR